MCVLPLRLFFSCVRLDLNHLKIKRRQIAVIVLLVFTLLGGGSHESAKGRARTVAQDPQSKDEATRLLEQIVRLRSEGKYAAAIPLAERLLEIYEKVAGAEHLDVATIQSNLAEFYGLTRNFVRAKELYKGALAT